MISLRTVLNSGRTQPIVERFRSNHASIRLGVKRYQYRSCNAVPSTFQEVEHPSVDDVNSNFAYVAVLGYPSAGKSSLMNRLVGGRVAAVSRKVQTTRRRIIGLCTEGNTQLAFCDTPGVVHRRFASQVGTDRRELARAAWGAAADAELGVIVVDVSRHVEHWKDAAALANDIVAARNRVSVATQPSKSLILALNKADKVKPRSRLLEAVGYFSEKIDDFAENFHDSRPFIISAFQGRGVQQVKDALIQLAPTGEFLMDGHTSPADYEDVRDTCVEHIWEKLLHRVHQEVPYSCSIENDSWKVLSNGDIAASEIIRVVRPSQIPLVVGHHGETVRFIAEEAAASVSEVLGRRLHLRISVALQKGSRLR